MVVAAVADLAADTDDEWRPDHRDVAVDLDGRVADSLLKALTGRQAVRELSPGLLPRPLPLARARRSYAPSG